MKLTQHIQLLANYNQAMNLKMFDAAFQLSDEALRQDRGAFFSSIVGTINHIAVADSIWLQRLSVIFDPSWEIAQTSYLLLIRTVHSLDGMLFDDIKQLQEYRIFLDELILKLSHLLNDDLLAQHVTYQDMKGNLYQKELHSLLMHFFNHQTHHRGQVSTLLTQAGVDIGVTDLNAMIPNHNII